MKKKKSNNRARRVQPKSASELKFAAEMANVTPLVDLTDRFETNVTNVTDGAPPVRKAMMESLRVEREKNRRAQIQLQIAEAESYPPEIPVDKAENLHTIIEEVRHLFHVDYDGLFKRMTGAIGVATEEAEEAVEPLTPQQLLEQQTDRVLETMRPLASALLEKKQYQKHAQLAQMMVSIEQMTKEFNW